MPTIIRKSKIGHVPLKVADLDRALKFYCDVLGLELMQNGVEHYWDRPKQEWPQGPNGKLAMMSEPLDLEDLLAES